MSMASRGAARKSHRSFQVTNLESISGTPEDAKLIAILTLSIFSALPCEDFGSRGRIARAITDAACSDS